MEAKVGGDISSFILVIQKLKTECKFQEEMVNQRELFAFILKTFNQFITIKIILCIDFIFSIFLFQNESTGDSEWHDGREIGLSARFVGRMNFNFKNFYRKNEINYYIPYLHILYS